MELSRIAMGMRQPRQSEDAVAFETQSLRRIGRRMSVAKHCLRTGDAIRRIATYRRGC